MIEYILLGILAPILLNLMHLVVGLYVVTQRGNIMSLGFTGISFLTKTVAMLFLTLPLIAQNQERLSVHYMDIKSNQYEEFLKYHNKKNEILEKAGFGKNFYKLYKVKDSDKAENYRYFLISNYTSDNHYKMTHNSIKELDSLNDKFQGTYSNLGLKFKKEYNHLYRRVYRVDND